MNCILTTGFCCVYKCNNTLYIKWVTILVSVFRALISWSTPFLQIQGIFLILVLGLICCYPFMKLKQHMFNLFNLGTLSFNAPPCLADFFLRSSNRMIFLSISATWSFHESQFEIEIADWLSTNIFMLCSCLSPKSVKNIS